MLAAGKHEQAESVLFALNRNRPGSAEWHLESAHLLVTQAFSFRESGAAPLSIVVARRALDQLAFAESKALAGDRALRAQIRYSIGLINERLAGTTTQAKASYQAAVLLDSQARAPAAALARLEKATREADERQKKKPGNG
ncbi:MAG: hypothetical protein Q7R45_02325 [Sulfuricaulis sp.]|nr:hypothetical protein [Sulfuricaulis sp.]